MVPLMYYFGHNCKIKVLLLLSQQSKHFSSVVFGFVTWRHTAGGGLVSEDLHFLLSLYYALPY